MEDEYIFDEDEGIEKDMKSNNQEPVSWQARVQLLLHYLAILMMFLIMQLRQ